MRFGCCGSIQDADLVYAAGFDFLEVNVQHVLQGHLDDRDWYGPDPASLPLPVEAANCLVPGNMPVVGPHRDLAALRVYMDRVARRASALGIRRLVFGSGGARRRPDDVDELVAEDHLSDFIRLAGEAAGRYDIILVIEHLHKGETNTINRLHQALRLADHVNHPSVQVLVDSFHYGLEGETDQAIIELGSRVRHVHVAEPVGRLQPGAHGPASPDAFDFEEFFASLRKVGYAERVAIEAKWTGPIPEVGPASLTFLKHAWEHSASPTVDV